MKAVPAKHLQTYLDSETTIIMEENHDLTPQTEGQSPMPSASEEDAVRMALGRCKRVEPDVDSEWQAFRQTIAVPESTPRRRMPTVGALVRVAIGMAAMLLVVWVLCRPQGAVVAWRCLPLPTTVCAK